MSIEGQCHFFTICFPGFVCFVLYLAKISGERLQDHWSSGSLYCSFFSNGFCNKFNQYLTGFNNAETATGKRPNSALDAIFEPYLPTPSMYVQNLVCIFSGKKDSNNDPQVFCNITFPN